MPLVLVQNSVTVNEDYDWKDIEGEQYHFPNQYKNRCKPGTPFVYYRGTRRLGGKRGDPEYFGFRLNKETISAVDWANRDYYMRATPAAIGTLTYIAFETRRLHEAMKPKGERYVPLEVTSLVRSMDSAGKGIGNGGNGPTEALAHCSGQVFDINYGALPPGEREALQFVLEDMGWEGYLGFVEETANSGTMHIGCSPSSRDFFTEIFREAVAAKHT